jgi:hypothetical protein
MTQNTHDANTKVLLKKNLKLLLYRLAAESSSPSRELESILQESISELYKDAQAALAEREKAKSHLRLVGASS